jgi:hypothetical protein
MVKFYKLDENHEVVPIVGADSVVRWASEYEGKRRVVRQEHVGGIFVSTVFLGLDHRFGGEGPPLVFETMAFPTSGTGDELLQERCSTWIEAEAQHAAAVEMVKAMKGGQ